MSFFSKLKHAFHNVEHAVAHVAKDVVHGVEHVAKDIGNAVHEVGNAVDDIAHGRLREALHDVASAGTNLTKAVTDTEKAVVDAAADATVDLHLSKAMDKMAANAKLMAAKMADNTVNAVDHIGHSIADDAATMASDAGHLAKDVCKGDFNAAKHDLSKGASDWGHAVGDLGKDAAELGKAAVANMGEVAKCATHCAADALEGMHISKSVDRFAEKASHAVDKGIDTTEAVVDQVADGAARDLAGTVDGAIAVGKDLANGKGADALRDGIGAAVSAASLACDLTPEGMAANAAIATMQTAHIGNAMVQDVVGGLIGGPKGLMKRAAETGLGIGAGEALNKVTGGNAATGLMVAGAMAPVAGDLLGGRRHHGGQHAEGPPPSAYGQHNPSASGPAHGPDAGPGAKTEPQPEAKPEAKSEAKPEAKPAPAASWHEVLGVGPNATRSEINQAYRKQSLQHHPDKGGDVEKQKEINNARDAALADLEVRTKATAGADVKRPEAKPETGPTSEPASAPRTTQRDARPDPAPSQADLSSSTQLALVAGGRQETRADVSNSTQLAVGSRDQPGSHAADLPPAAAGGNPARRDEDGRKQNDDSLMDSAGNAAGIAANMSTGSDAAQAAAAIAAARASANITMAAQNAIAQIQNEVALNEAVNHIREELGKGVKALAQ